MPASHQSRNSPVWVALRSMEGENEVNLQELKEFVVKNTENSWFIAPKENEAIWQIKQLMGMKANEVRVSLDDVVASTMRNRSGIALLGLRRWRGGVVWCDVM